MDDTFVCSHCNGCCSTNQRYIVEDDEICEDCATEETVICSHCGERIWQDDNAGDEDIPLCQSCYDQHYTSCERCGRILRYDEAYYENDDEDEPLCYECYSRSNKETSIHDYYYKPEPIFYGDGSRFMGVELEIDGAGEDSNSARTILNVANGSGLEHLYCKHDGSLDDGFELVTHPMTLNYHYTKMPWKNILNKATQLDYRSHQANTCGLHVHVSRNAFGTTEVEQDSVIARILYFFEKHWEELLKFSRRTQCQLERWAARYGYKEQSRDILDHAKKGYHGGRYTCINLQNTDTIEFRIFRGTLKYNTLIATLQLVDRVCDVALFMSDEEIKSMSWTTFVSGCIAPELVQYLKERQLYINEAVAGEEEI